MQKIKTNSIFLIDGSSLLYRSYYGIRPLHTLKGTPTQATYGFCRSIKKLIDDFDPKYLLLVWDRKEKTFRSNIFPEYKATRQAPPNDLFIQKEQIIEFAHLIKIKQISKPGYEADDLIFSIVQENKKQQIILIGPDKDLHQLISKNILILDPLKKEIIDEDTFINKRKFIPGKLAFYHSLLGDASDNIPGVKGIGKKGATNLVQQFDSLDNLYENLNKIEKPRIKKLLEEHKQNAFLSYKLFSLKYTKTKTPIQKMLFDKNNWKNANEFFQELEFTSLIDHSHLNKTQKTDTKEKQTSFLQASLPNKNTSSEKNWTCIIVQKESDLQKLIMHIKIKRKFAIDTETTGLNALEDSLVGLSIATENKNAYYIPINHCSIKKEGQLEKSFVLTKLQPILENNKIKKILHHTKFDQLVLWQDNVKIKGIFFDTLIAANLLRKEWSKINLKSLSMQYLNEKMSSFSDVLGKKYKTFAEVPINDAALYAAHDALQTFKLAPLLKKELKKEKKLDKLFNEIEMPLSQVLFQMEKTGISLDTKILEQIEKDVDKELTIIEKKIEAAIHYKQKEKTQLINLNSPKQIEELLFNKLKLPVTKKSITGQRSTDQEALLELSKIHPIPGLILKYRELFKLKSTYLKALPKSINPKTNKIHTSYSQTLVTTGRLSSSNPNLQNIPAGKNHGIRIRSAFIAQKGTHFLSADYSQIDLRVLAHLSGDKNLINAFLKNKDIHIQTASQIFSIPKEKVTNQQRQMGKKINFSIIYGLTPYGLSKDLGIKQSEAKRYIQKYFDQYPLVAKWIEKTVEQAKADGFVQTLFGKKRYIPGLQEKNKSLYEAARRIAINTPVQGTSAEIIKLAMIKIYNSLQTKQLKSKIILQIHDELILQCPTQEIDFIKKLVKKQMETVISWKIPLIITVRTGKNWAEITK